MRKSKPSIGGSVKFSVFGLGWFSLARKIEILPGTGMKRAVISRVSKRVNEKVCSRLSV